MPRRTRQGDAIDVILRTTERPLTPDEAHARASKILPRLGLATVYRRIRSLTEEGLLVGVDYPGQPARYEWVDGKQKLHFGCRSCDKLFALDENNGFEEPASPSLPPGFEVQGGEWILYGVCPDCVETNVP